MATKKNDTEKQQVGKTKNTVTKTTAKKTQKKKVAKKETAKKSSKNSHKVVKKSTPKKVKPSLSERQGKIVNTFKEESGMTNAHGIHPYSQHTGTLHKKKFARMDRVGIARSCLISLQKMAHVCKPPSTWSIVTIFLIGLLIGILLSIFFLSLIRGTTFSEVLRSNGSQNVSASYITKEIDTRFLNTTPIPPADFSDVDLTEFWEVWRTLELHLVTQPSENGEVDTSKPHNPTRDEFVEGAIHGLTSATRDAYTNYLNSENALKFRDEVLNGSIVGIGVHITIENGALTVLKPVENGPAAGEGVLTDDIILEVDGEKISGLTLSESVELIRGEEGTEVEIKVLRPISGEELFFVITRARIDIPTVEYEEIDGVFIIRLSTFSKKTFDLFLEALREYALYAEDTDTPYLLLDMRGNSGGILDTAVSIAGLFLPPDSVVLYDYRGSDELLAYRTKEPIFNQENTPYMTILVDRASASASEILADALRYYGVADIIGTTTRGKGSVQELKQVSDDDALLKITIAQWLTPGKNSISGEGITPDVDLEEELQESRVEAFRNSEDFDIDEFLVRRAIDHLKSKSEE